MRTTFRILLSVLSLVPCQANKPNQQAYDQAFALVRKTPGKAGIPGPVTTPAKGVEVNAGTPEVVPAKDRVSKDLNPHNFSSFGKLQGLKYNVIQCLLKDRNGNLWMGTVGGGITKYDGKFFTHTPTQRGCSTTPFCLSWRTGMAPSGLGRRSACAGLTEPHLPTTRKQKGL
ncbi:MAG: hypothetical protein IPH16_14080 [Haliscomenobacter sp.]|nr:hypothetical protein [Haliscomenobacter sp.]